VKNCVRRGIWMERGEEREAETMKGRRKKEIESNGRELENKTKQNKTRKKHKEKKKKTVSLAIPNNIKEKGRRIKIIIIIK
jgi:Zn-finger nucleic acid-binding protein